MGLRWVPNALLVTEKIWDGSDDMCGLRAGYGEMVLRYYILLNYYLAAGIEESNARSFHCTEVLKKR